MLGTTCGRLYTVDWGGSVVNRGRAGGLVRVGRTRFWRGVDGGLRGLLDYRPASIERSLSSGPYGWFAEANWMANRPPVKPPPWTRHAGIGVNYVAAVAGFGLMGWWIDSRWGTEPVGVLIGVALGLIGATYNLIRESMAAFDSLRDETKPAEHDDQDRNAKS